MKTMLNDDFEKQEILNNDGPYHMSKKIIELIDMNGINYHLKDSQQFYDHMQEFHASGTSIHEQNGYNFELMMYFGKRSTA